MKSPKRMSKSKKRTKTGASRAFSYDFEISAVNSSINIKKSPKFRIRRGLATLVSFLLVGGVVYGTYLILCWQVENDIVSDEVQAIDTIIATSKKDEDQIVAETIRKIAELEEAEERARQEEAERAAQDQGGGAAVSAAPARPSLYWQYIGTDIDTVDFNSLRITNPQTTAWLIVKNTNINYPVVQAHDNYFYLTHSYTGALNSSGWVFMDYEDDPEFNSRNTVIYAHGRWEGTMFGTLKKTLELSWLNNPNNHIVVTATPTQLLFWETFSLYLIPTTSDYITVNFQSDAHFTSFLNRITDRSAHNFGIRPTAADRVLTLSTCYDDNTRMVLHARLREVVKR